MKIKRKVLLSLALLIVSVKLFSQDVNRDSLLQRLNSFDILDSIKKVYQRILLDKSICIEEMKLDTTQEKNGNNKSTYYNFSYKISFMKDNKREFEHSIYYKHTENSIKTGPVTVEELKQMLKQGQIRAEDTAKVRKLIEWEAELMLK